MNDTEQQAGHSFKFANIYRGDNVPLCGICHQPAGLHKFSPSTKLQPTHPVPTPVDGDSNMDWLDEVFEPYVQSLKRFKDKSPTAYRQVKSAIAAHLQAATRPLNVTIDGKAAKDVGLFTGEELQAAEDRATDNATQHLYTASEVRHAIQQALSSKTDKGMVSAVIEDVGAELQHLKKGTER